MARIVMLVLVLVLDRASLFLDTLDLYCICFDFGSPCLLYFSRSLFIGYSKSYAFLLLLQVPCALCVSITSIQICSTKCFV